MLSFYDILRNKKFSEFGHSEDFTQFSGAKNRRNLIDETNKIGKNTNIK